MAQFPSCVWRPIQNNTGGRMSGNRGLLMHQQVGYGSLQGFFNNPASKVSAHFWIARDGRAEQYVDSAVTAWHATSLNGEWCGVEFEGYPTEPLTSEQIVAGGRLYADGARLHGWPMELAERPGSDRGFGYHRMGGVNKTACPSDLRLASRPAILSAAGRPGGPPSSSTPAPPAGGAPPTAGGVGAPPWPGRVLMVLRPYMSGDDVTMWQARMRERGWAIAVDSLYGPDSADKCRAFQSEKGLQADAMVGPETWGATWSAPIT
jgi:hypothetical protein